MVYAFIGYNEEGSVVSVDAHEAGALGCGERECAMEDQWLWSVHMIRTRRCFKLISFLEGK